MRGLFVSLVLTAAAGAYDLADFAALSREWQTCRHLGYTPAWDLDGSGCVEQNDLVLFANRWLMPTNLIVNGGFDGSSGWTMGEGWSINNGQATYENPTPNSFPAALSTNLTSNWVRNKLYRLTADIIGVSRPCVGIMFSGAYSNYGTLIGSGTKQVDFLYANYPTQGYENYFEMGRFPGSNIDWLTSDYVVIDNISLIDLTVGNDLVSNGDFQDQSSWITTGVDIDTGYAAWTWVSSPSGGQLSQNITTEQNKTYIISLTPQTVRCKLLVKVFGKTVGVVGAGNTSGYWVKALSGSNVSTTLTFEIIPTDTFGSCTITSVRVYEALEPLQEHTYNGFGAGATNAVSAFLAGKAMGWLP